MSGNKTSKGSLQTGCYAICVKEQINPTLLAWFDGFSIQSSDSDKTTLVGFIPDQSSLHGLLARIRDLNLTLISVNPITPNRKRRLLK